MKLYAFFTCGNCGNVVPLAQALNPPTPTIPAQEVPCAKCGQTNWQPVKAPS
jgi:ribosomal protein S27AE